MGKKIDEPGRGAPPTMTKKIMGKNTWLITLDLKEVLR